jgi:L-ascorbate metabolism protein UlaG (beta-lactamase superfamily)
MRIPVLILSAILIFSSVAGQDKKMIDQIREHKTGLAVWWIGQDSWIIKSGDLVISTDLFLQDEGRISPSPVNPHELAPILDIAFVTHGHGDHFEPYTNKILAAESKCKFVLPESCLDEAEDEASEGQDSCG